MLKEDTPCAPFAKKVSDPMALEYQIFLEQDVNLELLVMKIREYTSLSISEMTPTELKGGDNEGLLSLYIKRGIVDWRGMFPEFINDSPGTVIVLRTDKEERNAAKRRLVCVTESVIESTDGSVTIQNL